MNEPQKSETKSELQIEIIEIRIKEWFDVSDKTQSAMVPISMSVSANINAIHVENIILPYIPITDVLTIRNSIIKVLTLTQ